MTTHSKAVNALVSAQKYAQDFINWLDRYADYLGDTQEDATEMQALANAIASYSHLAETIYSRRMSLYENPPTDNPTGS